MRNNTLKGEFYNDSKKILKNKKFIKGTSLCLIIALIMGGFILTKKISKADSTEPNTNYDLSNLTESEKI